MSNHKIRRIGVLTGGGDAPGLNPAIRAVVYRAVDEGIEVAGIYDGWEGLLDGYAEHTWALDVATVRTWDRDGGTNLGSSRTNPFKHGSGASRRDRSGEVIRNIDHLGLDGLVAIGGEDVGAAGFGQDLRVSQRRIVGVEQHAGGAASHCGDQTDERLRAAAREHPDDDSGTDTATCQSLTQSLRRSIELGKCPCLHGCADRIRSGANADLVIEEIARWLRSRLGLAASAAAA